MDDCKSDFKVEIKETRFARTGNVELSISHNGYQFTTVTISKSEAVEIIDALREHFDI